MNFVWFQNGPAFSVLRQTGPAAYEFFAVVPTEENARLAVDALNEHQAMLDLRADLDPATTSPEVAE